MVVHGLGLLRLVASDSRATMASDKDSSSGSLRDEKVSTSSPDTQSVAPAAAGQPSFEDFLHFAALQRELEKTDGNVVYPAFEDKSDKGMYADSTGVLSELEKEKIVARRALRAVTWVSAFFLVRLGCSETISC